MVKKQVAKPKKKVEYLFRIDRVAQKEAEGWVKVKEIIDRQGRIELVLMEKAV